MLDEMQRPDDEYLRCKKQMCDELDSLDRDDDEADDGRQESQKIWKKASNKRKLTESLVTAAPPSTSRTLGRSVSDSTVISASIQKQRLPSSTDPDDSRLTKASINSRLTRSFVPTTLRQTASDLPSATASGRAIGKRKRDSSIKYGRVPLEQRIFNGLHFYFFPNNNAHPARRMRILKAVEYGAVWEEEWNANVTHAILDQSTGHDQLMRFLKTERLPESVFVVSEHYTAECIGFKSLLDPEQARFKVKGCDPPLMNKVDSTDSDTSLVLKPAGKEVRTQFAETPPQVRGPTTITAACVPTDDREQTLNGPQLVPDSFQQPRLTVSDALNEAIRRAKALEHVPLDEDETERPMSSEGVDSGDEDRSSRLKASDKRESKFQQPQDRFQCMQKHTGDISSTANLATIKILQQMADYYGQIGDEWRIRAYRKAMSSLRNHPRRVTTKEEALALPNVGERLAVKIEEIAFTNRLRRLDNAKAEPTDQVLQTFMRVYGAGLVQATRWVKEGYTTLEELLQKATLTRNQRIGIEHYEDFNSRIPRAEVEKHASIVRRALQDIDPAFEVIIGGSYRRGSKDSGDVDCIITRRDTSADYLRHVVLGQVIPQLTASNFLVADLAVTSKDDGSKWHGASRLPGSRTWRRLDLLLVPSDELGAALIYFTGNDIFNRSLRLLASTKGMRLNQRGLYRNVIRGPQRMKVTDGTLVEGKDEKRIFEALGVTWRPPEHRIC